MSSRNRRSDHFVTLSRRLLPALAAASLALAGCGETKTREVRKVEPVARDVPAILRGTIGAEASFRGIEPVLVSGLGIVVGLNGTGGGELPVSIAATMEREAARGGIGRGAIGAEGALGPVSPQEFLRSPNVAVVIVEARIAPGAPDGARFDVYVRALPGSSVTSLEGGKLWTTDLRIGPAAVFSAAKTRKIAEASGPIFINPFSDPSIGPSGELTVTRTSGRVLNGGVMTEPLLIEMILDNDSHTRARSIVAAINSKFPREPGDEGQTARGRGSSGAASGGLQSIALRVPRRYKDESAEFLQLVRHTRVDQSFAPEFARQYVEELKASPGLAEQIRWLLEASGKSALPFIASMYDYPEYNPRMAALTAGARLGDARAIAPLVELARSGPPGLRTDAMRLLGDMPKNPSISLAMRELLDEPNLDVRVAAYEALRTQRDNTIVRIPIGTEETGHQFMLELVPSREPMIYVTQQGEARVVVFGGVAGGPRRGESRAQASSRRGKYAGLFLEKPMLTTAFADRLMMAADSIGSDVRLRYASPRLQRPVVLTRIPEDVGEFIEFLARVPSPEEPRPGLAMTYSEVVGTLYELTRQGGLAATFATEEDRLRAEIFEAGRLTRLSDRPEGEADVGADATVFEPQAPAALPSAEPAATEPGSKIIPLNRPRTTIRK
jgi:hypothetical protein